MLMIILKMLYIKSRKSLSMLILENLFKPVSLLLNTFFV